MTNDIANLFVDVCLSKAKLTLFLDGNVFLIAITVSVYSLQDVLFSVLPDSSANTLCNAYYDCQISWFDIVFHRIWAKTNPDMR